jgi:hypothetical protein
MSSLDTLPAKSPFNEQILADFVNAAVIHPLSDAVVHRTIALCRQSKIKLPDAIIAATAGWRRGSSFKLRIAVCLTLASCCGLGYKPHSGLPLSGAPVARRDMR